jgi:NitT/TauT family transport system substrate-binding protein
MMRRAFAIAAAAMLVALAGCGGDDGGGGAGGGGDGGTVKLKVGTLPISNAAPLFLGAKKGFFEEEGLEIEPVIAQTGNDIITTMVSGDTQFGFVGYVPALSARSQDLPVKVVANSDNGAATAKKEWTQILVAKDSPIKAVKDLEGKTIASNALKGVGEVVIKASLDKQGVDPDSIKLLEVPFPEMPGALERGRVDAIWAPEPFLTQVLGTGARSVDSPLVTLGKNYVNGAYVTTDQYLGENADIVERFAKAMKRSNEYAGSHPEEVRAILGEYTEIPPEVAQKILLPSWPPEINRAQLEELSGYAEQYGVIKEQPSLDDLIWEGATSTGG